MVVYHFPRRAGSGDCGARSRAVSTRTAAAIQGELALIDHRPTPPPLGARASRPHAGAEAGGDARAPRGGAHSTLSSAAAPDPRIEHLVEIGITRSVAAALVAGRPESVEQQLAYGRSGRRRATRPARCGWRSRRIGLLRRAGWPPRRSRSRRPARGCATGKSSRAPSRKPRPTRRSRRGGTSAPPASAPRMTSRRRPS